MSTTNKYQLTENIFQLQNVTELYANTTVKSFTRPAFNVFDKGMECIAALSHIRYCTPIEIVATLMGIFEIVFFIR